MEIIFASVFVEKIGLIWSPLRYVSGGESKTPIQLAGVQSPSVYKSKLISVVFTNY